MYTVLFKYFITGVCITQLYKVLLDAAEKEKKNRLRKSEEFDEVALKKERREHNIDMLKKLKKNKEEEGES